MENYKVLWECVEKCRRLAQVCPGESRYILWGLLQGNRSWPGVRGYIQKGEGPDWDTQRRKEGQDEFAFRHEDFIRMGEGTGENMGGGVEKHGGEMVSWQVRLD